MSLLTTQEMTVAGLEATYAAATAGGDTVVADGKTFLHVKNGGGAPITVTIPKAANSTSKAGYGDIALADISVVVTNAEERMIPIPPASHAPGGIASIAYTAVTSVTVAAIRLPTI